MDSVVKSWHSQISREITLNKQQNRNGDFFVFLCDERIRISNLSKVLLLFFLLFVRNTATTSKETLGPVSRNENQKIKNV
jgi:hypothetical protein